MTFRFEIYGYLFWLFLIPAFLVASYYLDRLYANRLKSWLNVDVLKKISYSKETIHSFYKLFLPLSIVLFFVLALANPQLGTKTETAKVSTVNIYLALDISKSMDAIDIAPSRLIKAKKYLTDLILANKGSNFGIVLFAGSSYLQMPLTSDYAAAIMMINAVNTSYAGTQGTDIASVFDLIERVRAKHEGSTDYVILVTDGESHERTGIENAAKLHENGVVIYCVAAGTAEGGYIPTEAGYKKSESGEPIITKVNVDLINDIAKNGGGKAYSVEDETSVTIISKSIIDGTTTDKESKQIYDYRSWFQWLALVAFILMSVDLFKINLRIK